MRARFVNEDISNILRGKSTQEILNSVDPYELLLHAAFKNDLELAQAAIDRLGRDTTIDPEEGSPISFALAGNKPGHRMIKLLIDNGFEVSPSNVASLTKLYKQDVEENLKILDLLINTGVDLSIGLVSAAEKNNLEAVKKMVEAGANVNAKTHIGTPLSNAMRHTNPSDFAYAGSKDELINYLKNKGAKQ